MNAVQHLPVDRLHANPDNPRTILTGVDELAGSIGLVGVQQPLTVIPAGDGWMIVAGHRRHAAACRAGLDTVPCIVRTDLDASDPTGLLVFGLVENLARAELDPFDEGEAYAALIRRGFTQAEIARQVGVSAHTVTVRLKLLRLSPSERRLVREGVIKLTEAYDLVKTPQASRPRRIETNIERRVERTVGLLRSTAAWLSELTDHPHRDNLDLAAGRINDAAMLLAATTPTSDGDGDASPPGEMRGRLKCERCGRPFADHEKVGECPTVKAVAS